MNAQDNKPSVEITEVTGYFLCLLTQPSIFTGHQRIWVEFEYSTSEQEIREAYNEAIKTIPAENLQMKKLTAFTKTTTEILK